MKFVGIIFEICAGGGFFVMVVLVCDVFFFYTQIFWQSILLVLRQKG